MTAEHSRKRPGWVWAISIFNVFSVAWVILGFYLVRTGAVSVEPQEQAYFDSLGILNYAIAMVSCAAMLVGTVYFLLLRKVALYFFAIVFVVAEMFNAWEMLNSNSTQAIDAYELSGASIGSMVSLAICLYTWHLMRKGVLV